MRFHVIVSSSASLDIQRAKEYYETQSLGLGTRFGLELRDAVDRIAISPNAFSLRYKYLRAARLRHFPYLVYYRVDPKKMTVMIFRVFNTYQKLPWN